ncbi:MAG: serine hydrolase [Gemmatimonadaceae bacterium]|nr:serine hydrolase [Gemmatimonadaceae bacterium]
MLPIRTISLHAAACGLAITLATGCATNPPRGASPAPPPADPIPAIEARAAATPGAVVRLAAWRLDGRGPRLLLRADSLVHAASTMKVPVMITLAQRADRGLLQLDGAIPLGNRFASIVDGSPYTLARTDDSDDSVYARVGERVSLRWLATRMITHSSNLATNTLLTVVAADSVTAAMRALGATRMLVRRGVEDTPAFRAGLNNVTTAADLATILAAIATDRAASPAACAWMREVLFAQAYNTAIPTGLPAGTRIAHKTGDITRVEHDAAIVYQAGDGAPYVLVVLTSGIESQAQARVLIADIARIVHGALQR